MFVASLLNGIIFFKKIKLIRFNLNGILIFSLILNHKSLTCKKEKSY